MDEVTEAIGKNAASVIMAMGAAYNAPHCHSLAASLMARLMKEEDAARSLIKHAVVIGGLKQAVYEACQSCNIRGAKEIIGMHAACFTWLWYNCCFRDAFKALCARRRVLQRAKGRDWTLAR